MLVVIATSGFNLKLSLQLEVVQNSSRLRSRLIYACLSRFKQRPITTFVYDDCNSTLDCSEFGTMFLSWKQRWRKTSSYWPKSNCSNEKVTRKERIGTVVSADIDSTPTSKSSSFDDIEIILTQNFSGVPATLEIDLELNSTDSPQESNLSKPNNLAIVSFFPKVQVQLVPKRWELRHLNSQLYYSDDEYELMKNDATKELNDFRSSTECVKKKDILIKLGLWPLDDIVVGNTGEEVSKMPPRLISPIAVKSKSLHKSRECDCKFPNLKYQQGNTQQEFDSKGDNDYSIGAIQALTCSLEDASKLLYQPWPCFDTESVFDFDL